MHKTFTAHIVLERLSLTKASIAALRHLERYDIIAFTSKNAKAFFMQELSERRIVVPKNTRLLTVGPRNDLLTYSLRGKRILFPRSAQAPFDIVRKLRTRGAAVTPIVLYSTRGAALKSIEREKLLRGEYQALYFKSPSGVQGFMQQFKPTERRAMRALVAKCIGATTARAAREAGFSRIQITTV